MTVNIGDVGKYFLKLDLDITLINNSNRPLRTCAESYDWRPPAVSTSSIKLAIAVCWLAIKDCWSVMASSRSVMTVCCLATVFSKVWSLDDSD